MMMNLDSEKNFEAFEANKLSNYLIAVCEEDQSIVHYWSVHFILNWLSSYQLSLV